MPHLDTDICFGDTQWPAAGFLHRLDRVIASRADSDPEDSYTTRLLNAGRARCAQKVGEEGVEVTLIRRHTG